MIRGVGSPAGSRSVAGGGRAAGGMVARPALFGRLGGPARVTVVSAPAGSGKTVLLRSWIAGAGLAGRAAWVAAGREERDPQRFWLSVAGALRATGPGAGLVRAVIGGAGPGWVGAGGGAAERPGAARRIRSGWWSMTCTSWARTRCGSWSWW